MQPTALVYSRATDTDDGVRSAGDIGIVLSNVSPSNEPPGITVYDRARIACPGCNGTRPVASRVCITYMYTAKRILREAYTMSDIYAGRAGEGARSTGGSLTFSAPIEVNSGFPAFIVRNYMPRLYTAV